MPKQILVLEDFEPMHFVYEDLLAEPEFRVICCSSLAAFCNVLSTTKPDLVIADLKLDDGHFVNLFQSPEFCQRLKHCKLMIVSGNLDKQTKDTAIPMTVDAYLSKPFDGKKFLEKIRIILEPLN